ncbi:MAG: DNA primase [Proteobacteria bacterium]|nr:DNA primase [Pseudomonadota bacterium]
MALPSAFLDELRARTPLAPLIGRRTKLERAGRQWKACCPFHGEKTPSFYIYEDHYHCFGCGAHGDAISFVMQSDGAGFMEAIERLAGEAGLEVPKLSPAVAEAERRRHTLAGALEMAAAAYQRRLFLPEGRAALDYLLGRGLSEATIRRFGLGWSGEGRGALVSELGREGIDPDLLIEAGLLRADDPPARGGEFFFNRVMFPIRDRRGGVISFGGRTLGDGKPKYLNGPETPLFAKRRNLYALDLARAALRGAGASDPKGAHRAATPEVVVVEGYMDAIALHQAGFGGAVAPLGTALTEEHLAELWRLSPAPILCFDGDAAGARACARAAELALPLLAPDRSLRFAALPPGEDPDTLVLRHGPAAFQAVLAAARPFVDVLFDQQADPGPSATPEQRQGFRRRLLAAAERVADRGLAAEYRQALLDRLYAARGARMRPTPGGERGGPRPRFGGGSGGRPTWQPPGRTPPRPVPSDAVATAERMRILLAILLRHPELWADVGPALAGLDLPPTLGAVRAALADWADQAELLDSRGVMDHLTASGLAAEAARILATTPVPLPGCASPSAMPGEAEAGWWHIFGLMHRDRLEAEVAAANREFARLTDDATQRRLIALCTARDALCRGEQGETET